MFFPVEEYEEYSRHTFLIEINDLVFQARSPNSELSKVNGSLSIHYSGLWMKSMQLKVMTCTFICSQCLQFLHYLLLFFCYVSLKCCLFTMVLCDI